MSEQELRDAAEKDLAKIKVLETSATGWIKTHYAVVGAIVCLIIGFIAGSLV